MPVLLNSRPPTERLTFPPRCAPPAPPRRSAHVRSPTPSPPDAMFRLRLVPFDLRGRLLLLLLLALRPGRGLGSRRLRSVPEDLLDSRAAFGSEKGGEGEGGTGPGSSQHRLWSHQEGRGRLLGDHEGEQGLLLLLLLQRRRRRKRRRSHQQTYPWPPARGCGQSCSPQKGRRHSRAEPPRLPRDRPGQPCAGARGDRHGGGIEAWGGFEDVGWVCYLSAAVLCALLVGAARGKGNRGQNSARKE